MSMSMSMSIENITTQPGPEKGKFSPIQAEISGNIVPFPRELHPLILDYIEMGHEVGKCAEWMGLNDREITKILKESSSKNVDRMRELFQRALLCGDGSACRISENWCSENVTTVQGNRIYLERGIRRALLQVAPDEDTMSKISEASEESLEGFGLEVPGIFNESCIALVERGMRGGLSSDKLECILDSASLGYFALNWWRFHNLGKRYYLYFKELLISSAKRGDSGVIKILISSYSFRSCLNGWRTAGLIEGNFFIEIIEAFPAEGRAKFASDLLKIKDVKPCKEAILKALGTLTQTPPRT